MKTFDCKKSRPRSGLIMAKTKTQPVEFLENLASLTRTKYKDYKKLYKESGIFTKYYLGVKIVQEYQCIDIKLLEYNPEDNMRYVKIVFDVEPYYDRVIKDRAAKPVDMLSAIGGTMGLLTGFSIISGVEIFYFGIRIIFKIIMKRINKKQRNKEMAKNYF